MLMSKEEKLDKTIEQEFPVALAENTQEEEENPYLVVFKHPLIFEGVSYDSVDLTGLENLSAADMIAVNKIIERGGTVNTLPEMSLEYACLISARATGQPVEFFKAFPPRDAIKVKKCVTNFLYGED